jgi:outer membrane receptor protein involved in Fe transport
MKTLKLVILIVLFGFVNHSQGQKVDESELTKKTRDTVLLDEFYMDDIVVTANKTTEKNYEVPVSISSLSSYQQESRQIEDLTDLTSVTPGFHMPDYGSSLTSPIFIRGVGTRINEPTVGLYVDGIPYFDKATFNFNLYDISKIEILRGPQGTLYGRNSLGGLIKVHTENPKNYYSTAISLGYGNYDNRNIYLKQHLPVIKNKVQLSIAGNYSYEDGYYENVYTNNKIGGENNFSGRLKLDYQMSSSSDLHLIIDASKNRNNGYPYSMTENGNSLDKVSYNHESKYERNLATTGLVANKRWDKVKLKSVSSFQFVEDLQDIDQDFTTQQLFNVLQDRENKFFTQEVNLSNNNESRLEYVGGLFGYYQMRNKQVNVNYGPDAVDKYKLPGEMTKYKTYDKNIQGAAVFGQLTYNDLLIDGLNVTSGLRYAVEKTTLDYLYELEMMGNKSVKDEFKENMKKPVLLPKLSFHYKWTSDFVQYATITRGYKSGGFNSTIEREKDITFGPEYSTNYELGLKGNFFNKSLNVNGALYYIDWQNQQVYQPVPSGQGSMLKNVGESHSKGGELEMKFRPMRNLVFFTNFAYIEAKYDQYERDASTDYSGNFIPYIPRFTINAGGDYRYSFDSDLLQELRFHCSYNGIGKHFWNDENTLKEDYYGTINLRITAVTKNLNVAVWSKNITGADYNAFLFEFSPLQTAFAQRSLPARFGVKISTNIN